MDFFLVDVKSITPSVSPEQIDKPKLEKLANSILECEGLLQPLILKPTGPESYTIIKGDMEYYAAMKAYEKDPRKGEMVNAFIVSPKTEKAIFKQLQALENPIAVVKNHLVHKNTETVELQTLLSFQKELGNMMVSLPSQLTEIMKQMERKIERNFQVLFDEKQKQLDDKILELTKKINSTDNDQKKKEVYNENYNLDMKKEELISLVKERGIKGYSKKNKSELIELLKENDMS